MYYWLIFSFVCYKWNKLELKKCKKKRFVWKQNEQERAGFHILSAFQLISYISLQSLISQVDKRCMTVPRLRCRHKLLYDQTQSSAHTCVLRPKLQGLDGSSSALQSGPWSGVGLIRGQFGLKSLIIGVFARTWVWSQTIWAQLSLIRSAFERTWVW